MIRDLKGTIERQEAGTGPFPTLQEPSKPMLFNASIAQRMPAEQAAEHDELFG